MKIALITGASSGIGRETAKAADSLYNNLDEIWLVARREQRLIELSKQLRTKCRIFAGDLTEKNDQERLARELKDRNPKIRLLVNAAGFGKVGNTAELEENAQLGMIDLNIKALTEVTLMSLKYMERGSRIIQIASAAAFCPQPGFAVYAASKSYVLSFSRALNEELRDQKISVTAVCPGPADTEFFDTAGKLPGGMKDAVMASPGKVVKKAMKDALKRRPVSVYGTAMKAAYAACSVLPQGVILKVMRHLW